MKMYVMCGCPAQGKSTFIKNSKTQGDIVISRDRIRFELLSEDDNYFSKEKEVFELFKYNVEDVLKRGYNIWVDATFLTVKSRKWVLELASQYNVQTIAVAFNRPIETCLEWNKNRKGRSFVPESAIRNMHAQFEMPDLDKEKFDHMIVIGDYKNESVS